MGLSKGVIKKILLERITKNNILINVRREKYIKYLCNL